MKVITLIGRSDSGKTSSIKMLVNEMLNMGKRVGDPELMCDYKKKGQRSCIDQNKLKKCNGNLLQYKGDITIKFKWKGKSIGITSFGDDAHSIATKFDLFRDCDVFISAAHPDDDTIKYINSIDKGHPHILIYKDSIKSQRLPLDKNTTKIEEFCNISTAKEMLDIIEYLL